jgi:molecular chaperone HtpG
VSGASISRILKELEKMAKNKPEKYATFWKEFGMVMKGCPQHGCATG